MKRHFILFTFMLIIVGARAKDANGSVTGSRLNVRTKPSPASEVVCQLKKGDTIIVRKLEGEWVGIAIPSMCQGWVKAADLDGDLIRSESASVRVAPGAVFTAYATIRRGTRVKVLKTKGEWRQVEGELEGNVWVHVDYVELPKGMKRPVKAHAPTNSTNDQRSPSGEVTIVNDGMSMSRPPSVPGKAPNSLPVHEIRNENTSGEIVPISTAKRVVRDGFVVKLPKSETRPWNYALAAQINNRYYPLLYIGESLKDADKWAFHRVRITGDRQWVRGYPRPVVEVTDIQLVKE